MNTPHQPFNLAAKFAEEDEAGRVYKGLDHALKVLRFNSHVSRVLFKNEWYVSFIHDGEESSIPAPVLQEVRRVLSQGQICTLPTDALANIQARRAERRSQGTDRYESHTPTKSTYQYPVIRDVETKETIAEYPEQGQLVSQEPYTGPGLAPGSPVYTVDPQDVPEHIRKLAAEHQATREQGIKEQARGTIEELRRLQELDQAREFDQQLDNRRRAPLPSTPAASTSAASQERKPTAGKVVKPLIERYLTYLRIARENALARINKTVMSQNAYASNAAMARAYGDIYGHMAEQALKYRLAASAQVMINALRPRPLLLEEMTLAIMAAIGDHSRELDPDIETPILRIPAAPIWLELENPIGTNTGEICGIFLTCADREIERMLQQPQSAIMQETLQKAGKLAHEEYRWSMHFIDRDGTPKSHYQYYETRQEWEIIPDGEPCPTGECEVVEERSDLTGRVYKYIIPCNFCGTVLAYWRSWFTTALLAVTGEFAATEAAEWPRHREQTTHKVKRPNSPKYDEISVTHDYYLVSFDASVRHTRPERAEVKEPVQRSSWVEAVQEVNPDAVVYVRHDLGKTQRQLDPARNPRWKEKRTVDVRAHSKRVPMKVDSLQRRITRVIASKYQTKPAQASKE